MKADTTSPAAPGMDRREGVGGMSGRVLQPAQQCARGPDYVTTQLTLFNDFRLASHVSKSRFRRNRLLALLNNAGAHHWPMNRFRLHRASQCWLNRCEITVIMKRLIKWLTF